MLVGASILAGAINSIAGGGTLVSFPAAVLAGLSPIAANATNAVAMTPGMVAAAWGYRREVAQDAPVLRVLLAPALAGAVLGSALLLVTPARVFDAVVPVLVLGATLLLLRQNLRPRGPAPPSSASSASPASPSGAGEDGRPAWERPPRPAAAAALELAVGVYGGYFGAGIGIMMLALLAMIGGRDLHRMNGVKSVLGAAINAIASVLFVAAGIVSPVHAAIMATGASAGGFAGASLARRTNERAVRWVVVGIGFLLSGSLAAQRL